MTHAVPVPGWDLDAVAPEALVHGDVLVPRPDLVQRLLRVPPGGLGLIIAPSGYGGTTLLGQVAAASTEVVVQVPRPAARGSVRFHELLAAALIRAGIEVPGPPAPPVEAVSQALGDAPDILVLVDDLSDRPNSDVEDEFAGFLQGLPSSVRVIARARRAPQFDVSRLLAGGRLVLLNRSDLMLSTEQCEDYLGRTAPQMASESRSNLVEVCEGWVGALAAAARGHGDPTYTDPALWLLGPGLDLLVGPLVDQLSEDDRDLLVRTSVLDQLIPQACDAVIGRRNSAATLRSLSAAQVVEPLPPGEGPGYRLHGLLREYLRRLLSEQDQEVEVAAHRDAGLWFAEHGRTEPAITHLLEIGDLAGASAILTERVETLLDAGATDQVRAWYSRAPQLTVGPADLHLLAAGWAEALGGHVPDALGRLVALEEHLVVLQQHPAGPMDRAVTQPGGARWLETETVLLRAYLEAWQGQACASREHVRRARSLYAGAWDRAAHQTAALLEARVELWTGHTRAAAEIVTSAASRPQTHRHLHRVTIPSLAAQVAAHEGRALRARFLAEQALESLEGIGRLTVVDDCDAHVALALSLLDLGDLHAAARVARALVGQGAMAGHVAFEAMGEILLARILAASGDPSSAEDHMQHVRTFLVSRSGDHEMLAQVDRAAVEVAVDSGDRRRAIAALGRLRGPRDPFAAVRVAGMGDSVTEAEVISMVREHRPVTPREVVDVRLLMALALAPGRPREAAMHLRTAADLAVEQGMLRALCGRGEAMVVLAERIRGEQGSESLRVLLDHAHLQREAVMALPRLSPGEHDLLDRLKSPRVNRELAEDLGISVNTLKTRLRRLYFKLGVHDRRAACDVVDRSVRPVGAPVSALVASERTRAR